MGSGHVHGDHGHGDHGHGDHSHGDHVGGDHGPLDPVAQKRGRLLLGAILIPIAIATLVGLFALWPDGSTSLAAPQAQGSGIETLTVEVREVLPRECSGIDPGDPSGGPTRTTCGTLVVALPDGGPAAVEISREIYAYGVEPGTKVRVLHIPSTGDFPDTYAFGDFERRAPLGVLAFLFAVAVIAVARLRGLFALVGLVVAFGLILKFMLPAMLAGSSPILVGLVGSSAILYVVLYLAHGLNLRTSTALLGTLIGVATVAGLAVLWSRLAYLTGLSGEENFQLSSLAPGLGLPSVIVCGVIIAGLGVLNDVTITQASAVWELKASSPDAGPRSLFSRGMRIGRDHIASTVYTIAFAYAGTALPTLLVLSIYARPMGEALTSAAISEEIVRTLVGSIGLVLAIPITTAVAAAVVSASAQQADPADDSERPSPTGDAEEAIG